MAQRDEETLSRWGGSAPYWEKNRDIIHEMFAPITEALIEEANVTEASRVLDVATGPGEPALSIAASVGSRGKVFGIDPVPGMIAAAGRAARRLGLKNAQFQVASADLLPYPADTFDAAVSRFGVMFFPSPLAGVAEMLRVLKHGKKLALAVWHFADDNPFHYVLSRVVDRFVEPRPLPPDAPDAFRFAAPGKLLRIVSEAGAVAASERLLRFPINVPTSLEAFWTLRCEMSDKLRERLSTLSTAELAEVKRQSLDAFRPYATESGLRFPASVLIVSGAKPC